MATHENAQQALDQARDHGDLQVAVVVAKDNAGKLQLFLEDADREKLIVLLERAKSALVRSLD